jgi:hypothetical protein
VRAGVMGQEIPRVRAVKQKPHLQNLPAIPTNDPAQSSRLYQINISKGIILPPKARPTMRTGPNLR